MEIGFQTGKEKLIGKTSPSSKGNDMEFKLVELIKYPLDAVYDTYRDHLADLVSYLPNVERIEKLEQQATPNGVKQLNRWKVSGAIPRPLRAFFSDQLLTYLDHADWNDSERHVEWRFEMGMMTEAIDCHGTNFFRGVSENSTELTLTGELTIDLSKIRAIPRFLYGLAPTFENFILNLVRPNFTSICHAVGKYLDEQRDKNQ